MCANELLKICQSCVQFVKIFSQLHKPSESLPKQFRRNWLGLVQLLFKLSQNTLLRGALA